MALIKCPECGKEISDTAKNCIHCGYVLKEDNNTVQPQTVIISPEKGKSAKKSLNTGITIIITIMIISSLVYKLMYGSDIQIGLDNGLDKLDNYWFFITFLGKIFYFAIASIVMSILLFAVPMLRKKWFEIIYILISISAFPLIISSRLLMFPAFTAYIVGIISVIKSMIIKD